MEGEGDEEAQAVSALIHHPQDVQNGRSAKEEKKSEEKLPCCVRLGAYLQSTAFSIYLSHLLSSWGDRMWSYAVGMYLAELSPQDLRLVAGYGLSMGAATVLMGAIIGEAVDRYPRLKVARTVLAVQNLLVAACAILVCLVFYYRTFLYSEAWRSGICEAAIITITVIGNLFSVGRKISVEKDWISVICTGDSAKLARLSSTMRAIDQLTIICAPILTGLIMTYGSMMISAICIAAWNLMSVFIEYGLLLRIYNRVPALAVKNDSPPAEGKAENTQIEDTGEDQKLSAQQTDSEDSEKAEVEVKLLTEKSDTDTPVYEPTTSPNSETRPENKKNTQSCCTPLCHKMFAPFLALRKGWSVYFSYDVKFAGLGLACVYMTVLGFDNISNAYAYHEGANQAMIGGFMSLSAVVGITASFVYPKLRACIGVERSGMVGALAEIAALTLCVVSIWCPGSPFDITPNTTQLIHDENRTVIQPVTINDNSTMSSTLSPSEPAKSFISLGLLVAGMIAARFGLWTFDLSVSQLLLERVDPSQRGVVNGVQSSLNMIMDMLKFVLVIGIPKPAHYGILIMLSFCFVSLGGVSFGIYSHKVTGRIFHCGDCNCCTRKSSQDSLDKHETTDDKPITNGSTESHS